MHQCRRLTHIADAIIGPIVLMIIALAAKLFERGNPWSGEN